MAHSLSYRLALFPTLLLALACDRNLEPYVAPEDEPPRLERPVRVPGLENPTPAARMPMGPPAEPGTAASENGAPIRGRVVAGEGVEASSDGVLFVIARGPGGGPPLAVKRLPVGPFPLEFEIGPADVMVAGRPFVGPIALNARIDLDGNALSPEPEAPRSETASGVETGAQGVELRLERPAPD